VGPEKPLAGLGYTASAGKPGASRCEMIIDCRKKAWAYPGVSLPPG